MGSQRKNGRRGMGKTAPARGEAEGAEHLYAAPDTAREIRQWLSYLGAERRMSPETVEAYGRDVRQFLAFLNDHFGRRVSRIPSGTPMAIAKSIDTPTSHRCSAVSVATSRGWVKRKFIRLFGLLRKSNLAACVAG